MLATIGSSIRQAVRPALRRPLFSLAVIVLLGLAIGTSTGVFSVLDAVVLQATPFPEAERLFAIQCRPHGASTAGACPIPAAVGLRDQSLSITDVAYYSYGPSRLDYPNIEPQVVATRKVSSSFFSTFMVFPLHGRWFFASDDASQANNLVVLSYSTWQHLFSARLTVVGNTIYLDDKPYVVVGIMPQEFTFPSSEVGAWVLDPLTVSTLENASAHDSTIIVRIGAESSASTLRAELGVIATRLPETAERPLLMEVVPLRDIVLGSDGKLIWWLFAATHFLLFIIGANLTNLIAARSTSAYRMQWLRIALGCTRKRLLAGHLMEYLFLAILAWPLAVVVAQTILQAYQGVGGLNVSRAELATIGGRAWLYSAGFCAAVLLVAAGVSFVPVAATRFESVAKHVRNEGFISEVVGLRTIQRALLVVQIALVVVLAMMASAGTRLLFRVHHLPLGFEPEGLTALMFDPPPEGTESPAGAEMFQPLLHALGNMPHIEEAAIATTPPLAGASFVASVPVEDRDGRRRTLPFLVKVQVISPDYFRAMRIPLIAGHTFSDSHGRSADCAVVVSRSFANGFADAGSALGRTVFLNEYSANGPTRCTIIGVVGDVRDFRIQEDTGPAMYFSYLQHTQDRRTLLIRSSMGSDIAPMVRAAVGAAHLNRRVRDVAAVSGFVENATVRERLLSYQVLFFAACGYAASLTGLVAIINWFLAEKRRDIVVRLALGASRGRIMSMLARDCGVASVVGALLGAGAAYVLYRASSTWAIEFAPMAAFDIFPAIGFLAASVMVTLLWPLARVRAIDVAQQLRVE